MRAIGMAVGLGLLAAAPAWAEGLAITPGLWEVTPAGNPATGQPVPPPPAMPQIPADALAKMTPEQQAMVQQRMAAAQNAGAARLPHRVCLTQAIIDKGFATGDNNRSNCVRTITGQSATQVDVSIVCTGAHAAAGTFTVRALDPKTMETTVDMTGTMRNGQTVPIHRVSQSHWVAADCGDVQPRE